MNSAEPNLSSLNVFLFEFSGRLKLGRDRIREIIRQEKAGRADVLIYANSYQSNGKQHYATAVAHRVPYKPDFLSIDVAFSIVPILEFKHETAKPVADLLGLLAEDRTDATFRCNLTLRYPDRDWHSLVRLPFNLFDISSMPFDEIRGFRAVKSANGGRTKYSIIVDRPENKDYQHSVSFSLVARCEPVIIEALLTEGTSVSRQLIRPRSPRAAREAQ